MATLFPHKPLPTTILLLWYYYLLYHHHKMAKQIYPTPSQMDLSLLNLSNVQEADKITSIITQEQIIPELLFEGSSKITVQVADDKKYGVLEALNFAKSSLIVLRRPENAIHMTPEKRLLAFAQYDIVDNEGHQLYIAVEQTTKKALKWSRDARTFTITMYDHNRKKILTIRRPCSLGFCCGQYYCFLCLFGFKGCGNNAIVTLCDGNEKLGRISQDFSCQRTILKIYDDRDHHIMTIAGKLVNGIFDVWFTKDGDDDEPIAMIETSMTAHEVSAFYKIHVANYEDPYGLTFLRLSLTPRYKVLIIAAIILMDYMFCKPSTDYPHYLQVIPSDFKPEDQTREKVFADGSKEIIVTSIKPRHNLINKMREQRRCGCCRWFFSFICLCFPLGFARNGCRCVQLVIFAILLLVGGLSLVIVYIFVWKK